MLFPETDMHLQTVYKIIIFILMLSFVNNFEIKLAEFPTSFSELAEYSTVIICDMVT